jgi:cysteine-rich repeat protein
MATTRAVTAVARVACSRSREKAMHRLPATRAIDARRAIGRGPGWLGPVLLVLLALASAACLEQPYLVCDTGLVCQLGYECSPRGDFCALPKGCGNGRIDFGEVCEDGNRVSGDGCSQDCRSDESCGNGVRDRWETCDDGNRTSDDGCSRICRLELCDNGTLDPGETCDDGGSENGDGCSADCLSTEECGNDYVDIVHDEECDDGNTLDGDGCSADCLDENCGNGVVDPGERCDGGDTANGDGCSADCKSDERCGNGIVDFSIGEQCDDSNTANGDGCHADCRRSACGNGAVDVGEACDDGNTASGDGCSVECLYDEDCGNGVLGPGELCDPGSGERCNADCSSDLTCGNAYHDTEMEQCDDGESSPYCDFDCTRVSCGDGIWNGAAGETCDQDQLPLLASLAVSGFAPAIELMPDTFEYEVELPLSQSSATVTATVATPGDTLTIAGAPVASGVPSAELPLNLGDNPVDIVVETPAGVQRLYRLTLRRAGQLAQYGYGKASNTGVSDLFGYSVALSGDTLAIGALYEASAAQGVGGDQDDNSAPGSGAVYVFRRTGTAWQQEAYLKASNTGANDLFGASVALSGDTLAVGARGEDSAAQGVGGNQDDESATDSGAVYVFRRTGTVWQQEAYVKASNTGAGDSFGVVALAGDTLAVGARGEDSAAQGVGGNQADESATQSGAVYVFRRTGTVWQQEAYVKASNTDVFDGFGTSVALAGDTLAVGAPYEASAAQGVGGNQADESMVDSGAVYVFRRTGTVWQQEAYVKASNTGAGDEFGIVALAGDTLAVGARFEDSAAPGVDGNQADESMVDSGAVYVFRRTGTVWQQEAYVKASNPGAGDGTLTAFSDEFGRSVALAGDTLAVGAPYEASAAQGVGGNQDNDDAPYSGAAYVFRRTGTAWQQEAYVKASNTEDRDNGEVIGDAFGHSVALAGDTLAVGALYESSAAQGVNGDQADNGAWDSGAVYIFH